MGKLNFTVSVDDNDIPDRIKRGIKSGMRDASSELLDLGEHTAKSTIQSRGRVWRRKLISSFDQDDKPVADGRYAELSNESIHAAAVEHGAKFPLRGPPLEALIPWVLTKWNPGSGDGDGDGGPSGSTSKDSTTRSKEFSPKPKLENQSSQKNYSKIADETWASVDGKVTQDGRLSPGSSEEIKSALQARDEFDAEFIDEIDKTVGRWKMNSRPGNDRVDKYSDTAQRVFKVDGSPRGEWEGDTEVEYVDALKAWSEISKIKLQEELGDENGRATLTRGMTYETPRVAKEIFDDPSADRWEADVNVLDNYTTSQKKARFFDKGLIAERDVSIEDDVIIAPDFVFTHADGFNRDENEIHLRGGNGAMFRRDQMFFTYKQDTGVGKRKVVVPYEDFAQAFEDSDFSSLSDDQLFGLRNLVEKMYQDDVTVGTPAGQSRIVNLRDEYISRELYLDTGYTQDIARQIFNGVI